MLWFPRTLLPRGRLVDRVTKVVEVSASGEEEIVPFSTTGPYVRTHVPGSICDLA